MKIAVLSGKGGTGKTLVSVNLAASADSATYVDCDVEEPNGHLFFKPENTMETPVTVKLPVADPDKCTGCGRCAEFCKFGALACVKGKWMLFDDVCHSCGGCSIVCPENAISERDEALGRVERGTSGNVDVYTGFMNIGEASGVPVIKELLKETENAPTPLTVIDCPPGSACTVRESIEDADYCILVAEPTVFGAHNLSMVHELVKVFGKPFGAVLNKCMDEENPSYEFCKENGIRILSEIPFDKTLGTLNSEGKIAVRENAAYRNLFRELLYAVEKEVRE